MTCKQVICTSNNVIDLQIYNDGYIKPHKLLLFPEVFILTKLYNITAPYFIIHDKMKNYKLAYITELFSCPNSTETHVQEISVFEPTHSYTNLHNSVEEAGVTEVIYAFDRDQGAVDGWTLAFGRVSII